MLDEGVIVEIVRPGTGDPVPGARWAAGHHHAQPRLPAGPLWHRRPVAVLPGSAHRPHQHPHQGLDGPGRPDHQGARHVRAPWAGSPPLRAAFRRCSAPGWWSAAKWPTTRWCCRSKPPRTAEGLAWLSDAIREVTKLRGEVQMVPPGTLLNDGKVIEDARSYK